MALVTGPNAARSSLTGVGTAWLREVTDAAVPIGVFRPVEVLVPADQAEDAARRLATVEGVGDAVAPAGAGWQAQDDRLTKMQQSMGKLQQSMESAASRFSRIDKAVAILKEGAK